MVFSQIVNGYKAAEELDAAFSKIEEIAKSEGLPVERILWQYIRESDSASVVEAFKELRDKLGGQLEGVSDRGDLLRA